MLLKTLVLATLISPPCSAAGSFRPSTEDATSLASFFGADVMTDLKTETMDSGDGRTHEMYMIRYVNQHNQLSNAHDVMVADHDGLYFCRSYLDVMEQVIVDGKPATLELFHTQGDSETKYGLARLAQLFSFKRPLSKDEAEAKKILLARKTVNVTVSQIQKDGFDRHALIAQNCNNATGALKSGADAKFQSRRFKSLIDKLVAASKAASSAAAPIAATTAPATGTR